MPIYEYQCKKCSEVFELFESINSNNETRKCSRCGGDAKRIISMSHFQLKGSGWYVTDYKGKKASSNTSSDKSNADTKKTGEKCKTCPTNTAKSQ